jgi:hypothetical protein
MAGALLLLRAVVAVVAVAQLVRVVQVLAVQEAARHWDVERDALALVPLPVAAALALPLPVAAVVRDRRDHPFRQGCSSP